MMCQDSGESGSSLSAKAQGLVATGHSCSDACAAMAEPEPPERAYVKSTPLRRPSRRAEVFWLGRSEAELRAQRRMGERYRRVAERRSARMPIRRPRRQTGRCAGRRPPSPSRRVAPKSTGPPGSDDGPPGEGGEPGPLRPGVVLTRTRPANGSVLTYGVAARVVWGLA